MSNSPGNIPDHKYGFRSVTGITLLIIKSFSIANLMDSKFGASPERDDSAAVHGVTKKGPRLEPTGTDDDS